MKSRTSVLRLQLFAALDTRPKLGLDLLELGERAGEMLQLLRNGHHIFQNIIRQETKYDMTHVVELFSNLAQLLEAEVSDVDLLQCRQHVSTSASAAQMRYG